MLNFSYRTVHLLVSGLALPPVTGDTRKMILLTVFFICLCGLYIYSLWTYGYWKGRKVPNPKPVPLFGNIKKVVFLKQYPGHCYQEIYSQYPDERVVGLFQLHHPALLLRDPAIVRQCLVADFEHFTDRGFHHSASREPLTGNLVNLRGRRWRALRAKLTPAFSSGKIKGMFPLLQLCSAQLQLFIRDQLMKSGEVLEMREATARFTTDVIGTVAFGLQFEAMAGNSIFREMGRKALEPSGMSATAKAMRTFTPWLFDLLRFRTFPQEVDRFFTRVVKETMEERIKNNYQRNDFLQLLMQIREATTPDDEFQFTDDVMAAQAFIFFLAGFETSSTTLSYCLYELAKQPELQEALFREICQLYSAAESQGAQIGYDQVADMALLEMVLLETMRMYPPVGNLCRVCTKRYTLPDSELTVEEGVSLVVPVLALHHDPKYWAEPQLFRPGRFADRELQKAPFYLPFGVGPRVCIGQRFALVEMKVALMSLIQEFTFALSERSPPQLQVDPKSFIMAPTDGVWLRVTPRPYHLPDFVSSHL